MTTLNELKKMREEYKAQVRKAGREALLNELQEFFEAQDKYTWVQWTQYTPYFNDGDPCVFGLGHIDFLTDEDKDCEDYVEGPYISTYRDRDKYEGADALAYDLKKTLRGNEDILEEVFGDHAKVTATSEGISVEEYYHD